MKNYDFIVSDVEFSRKENLNYYGFSTIYEMNEHLIEKWNEFVSKKHNVLCLGNFMWMVDNFYILFQLNGYIDFMLTPSDDAIVELLENDDRLESVNRFNIIEDQIIFDDENKVIFSYYPLADFPLEYYNIFGYSTIINSDPKTKRINTHWKLWHEPMSYNNTLNFFRNEINV